MAQDRPSAPVERPPAPPPSEPASILRNRHFLALWAAQAISQTAQQAIWFGMIVVVETVTQSSAQLSVAVLSTIIPAVLLGLVAGALVDMMNKKSVLVTTNFLRAATVLGYLLYPVSVYAVYLVNFVFVAISQFFGPAEASSIPQLVSRRQLVAANSAFNLTYTGSQLVGIVILAPLVINLFGPEEGPKTLFVLTSLLYVVAGALVYTLPPGIPPEQPLSTLRRETVVREVISQVDEAWTFIRTDSRTWWSMVYITLMSCLMLILATLAPRFAVLVLHIQAVAAVLVLAPAFIGIVGVTLILSRLVTRYGEELVINVGLAMTGLALLAIASLEPANGAMKSGALGVAGTVIFWPLSGGLVPPLMAISLFLGAGYALASVPSQAVLMERAPIDSRGRIFSVLWLGTNVAAIVPLVFLGSLADLIDISVTIAAIAVPVFVTLAFSVRAQRQHEANVAPS